MFLGLAGDGGADLAVADLTLALDVDWPAAPPPPESLLLLSPASEWLDTAGAQLELVPERAASRVARLTIRVPASRLRAPGDYRISLLVKVPSAPPTEQSATGKPHPSSLPKNASAKASAGPSAWDSQRLTLTIKRPEAKLAALPAVLFDPWHGWWPTVGESIALELPLTETAGRIGVLATVAVESATDRDGRILSTAVKCPSTRVAAGTTEHVPCTAVAADFPLGSSKIALAVRASTLSAPLEGTIEIRRRKPALLIVATIFLGLLAGYAVRVALTAVIRDREARATAAALDAEICAAMLHADSTFQSIVRPAWMDLQKVLKRSTWINQILDKTDPLGDALKKAAQASADATANLRQRQATEAAAVADLRRITKKDWILPKEAAKPLEQVRALVDAASVASDLAQSKDLREQAESLLTDELKKILLAWPSKMQASIEAVESRLAPDMATARAGMRALGQRRQALVSTSVELDRLESFLRNLAAFGRAIIEELRMLGPRLGVLTQTIFDCLDGCGVDPVVVQEIKDAAAIAARDLAVDADFEDKLGQSPGVLSAFNGRVSASLTKAAVGRDPQIATRVAELLSKHLFVEAGRVIALNARSGSRPSVLLGMVSKGVQQVAGLVLGGAGAGVLTGFDVVSLGAGASGNGQSPGPRKYATVDSLTRARQSLLRAKATQLVILGVLAELIGCALLFDRFVGQWTEIAAIFGWSFAIDLSTDVIANLAKSLLKG